MNAEKFRSLALEVEGAFEGSHMRHADFRVLNAKGAKSAKGSGGGRIFASLSEDEDFGVVKLSPDEQGSVIEAFPGQFEAMSGAWGRAGWTKVVFKRARVGAVRKAIAAASAKVVGARGNAT